VSWEHELRQALPPAVLVLAILIGAILLVRDGPTWSLLVWAGLALGAVLVWTSANHPLDTSFATPWGQLGLVLPGAALAAVPLYRLMRSPDPPHPDPVPALAHG
jgi:drug/metabolite transporter (DMT)-like permease